MQPRLRNFCIVAALTRVGCFSLIAPIRTFIMSVAKIVDLNRITVGAFKRYQNILIETFFEGAGD